MEARVLIAVEQIRRIAVEQELSAGVVEKDYALTWLLKGLYARNSGLKDNLLLKGGTCIRKVYFPKTWRFSEDLDFTLIGDKDADGIRGSMETVFQWLRTECGVVFSFDSFHAAPGAIIANVQFVGPLNFANGIRHDISLNEKMVNEPERRTLESAYPDLPDFDVFAYPLTEIFAEKISSIMQRGYSRDYYDVWRLMKESVFKNAEIKKLVIRKCTLNGIEYEPKLLFDEERLGAAGSFWMQGLAYLTKELPDLHTVVSELKERLSFLE